LAEQSTIEVGQTVVEGHISLMLPALNMKQLSVSELLAVAGDSVVGATASEIILGLANNNTQNNEKERGNSGELNLECIGCDLGGCV
jgi:hypothetical protein